MFKDTSFLYDDEIKLVLERVEDANVERGWVPAYYFAICNHNGVKMGTCDLRIGHNDNSYYGGNIGYSIDEEYRGHHYAGKACLLLFKLARLHDLGYLYITCDPENLASRKTCEYVGAEFLGVKELPLDNEMRVNLGDTEKCIFRFTL